MNTPTALIWIPHSVAKGKKTRPAKLIMHETKKIRTNCFTTNLLKIPMFELQSEAKTSNPITTRLSMHLNKKSASSYSLKTDA
jgi:hypothetical protein